MDTDDTDEGRQKIGNFINNHKAAGFSFRCIIM